MKIKIELKEEEEEEEEEIKATRSPQQDFDELNGAPLDPLIRSCCLPRMSEA
jgi:hypothetical protein